MQLDLTGLQRSLDSLTPFLRIIMVVDETKVQLSVDTTFTSPHLESIVWECLVKSVYATAEGGAPIWAGDYDKPRIRIPKGAGIDREVNECLFEDMNCVYMYHTYESPEIFLKDLRALLTSHAAAFMGVAVGFTATLSDRS